MTAGSLTGSWGHARAERLVTQVTKPEETMDATTQARVALVLTLVDILSVVRAGLQRLPADEHTYKVQRAVTVLANALDELVTKV
jgi:hypothetical protein